MWLSLLLLFGATPKDFIHQFADHRDTVHATDFGHEGVSLEKSHHHCSFLDFQLLPFTAVAPLPFLCFAGCADYHSYNELVASRFLSAEPGGIPLRGPPARTA